MLGFRRERSGRMTLKGWEHSEMILLFTCVVERCSTLLALELYDLVKPSSIWFLLHQTRKGYSMLLVLMTSEVIGLVISCRLGLACEC
jgi:hypothetical protein